MQTVHLPDPYCRRNQDGPHVGHLCQLYLGPDYIYTNSLSSVTITSPVRSQPHEFSEHYCEFHCLCIQNSSHNSTPLIFYRKLVCFLRLHLPHYSDS